MASAPASAFAGGDTALKDKFNAAIAAIRADGTCEKIRTKYSTSTSTASDRRRSRGKRRRRKLALPPPFMFDNDGVRENAAKAAGNAVWAGLFSAFGSLWAWANVFTIHCCGPGRALSPHSVRTPLLPAAIPAGAMRLPAASKITITVAVLTLPLGLVIGFLVALAQQSRRSHCGSQPAYLGTLPSFAACRELLTLFASSITAYRILLQTALAYVG